MLTVDQNQCEITMPKTYARLTEDERYQIYEDKFMGLSHRQIAKRLNRLVVKSSSVQKSQFINSHLNLSQLEIFGR